VKKRTLSLYLLIFFLSFCTGAGIFSFLLIFVDKFVLLGIFLAIVFLIFARGKSRLISLCLLSFLMGWVYISFWGLPESLNSSQLEGVVDGFVECYGNKCF